jgi:hypothetical protein
VVALEGARMELVRYVLENSAFQRLTGRVLSRVVMARLFGSEGESDRARVSRLLSLLPRKLFPELEGRLTSRIAEYVEASAARTIVDTEKYVLAALDAESVREIVDEVWDAVSGKPLREATAGFTTQDLEDFVVLGYEFWLKFRKSPYFRGVSREVVQHLFEKYGPETLATVIADMGVTQSMVANEFKTFWGPVLEQAARTGFLEQQLRDYLSDFYRSPAARRIMAR